MVKMRLNRELENTYTLLEEIGSGGGGTVFKAYHRRLKKEVVLKKIHSNLTGGNIRAEADILKNLKSKYLPQVLDFFELGGDVYTVMDFIPGQSLKDCLKEEQKFKQNQVLKWLDQLCEAVEELHDLEPPIIHGDIKPDNIMLTPDNNICLIDFNVSGDFENADVAGYTAGYAAPEQVLNFKARKERLAAKAADVRSGAAVKTVYSGDVTEVDRGRTAGGDIPEEGTGAADRNVTEVEGAGAADRDVTEAESTETADGDVTEVEDTGAADEDATEVEGAGAADEDVIQVEDTGAADEDVTEVEGAEAADWDVTEVEDTGTADRNAAKVDSAEAGSTNKEAGGGSREAELSEYTRIPVDARSDIYSIGATVYHLLTGERPGVGNVTPVWEYPVKLEESFAYLIMKCLEQEPRKRFQSVKELHKAVKNVHKSGKRYRALLRRQFFVRLVLGAGMIGFAVLAASGRVRMQEEKQEKYFALVDEEKDAREQGDHAGVLSGYQEAIALFPERGEAYLEVSLSLYQQKRYEDVVTFTCNEIEKNVTEIATLGELYYIYGNSCLELEDYLAAADAFRKAVFFHSIDARYYQDYAISLARMGKTDEASEKLEQAVKYGLGNDGLYYTQGEIAYAGGDLDAARDSFYDCIATTEDDYRKMRAYLMCSRILGEQELTEARVSDDIAILKKAVDDLPREYSNVLLERLAQAYIDMGKLTDDGQYDMQALKVFETIAGYGWATYTTYHNMAVLCQKNGMYQQGLELLESMLELFGENYNTYKRMAFMEASLQAQVPSESRSYSQFAEYCKTAMRLYQEQLSGNQTDPEMITLQNLYDQAVQGGWIEE